MPGDTLPQVPIAKRPKLEARSLAAPVKVKKTKKGKKPTKKGK